MKKKILAYLADGFRAELNKEGERLVSRYSELVGPLDERVFTHEIIPVTWKARLFLALGGTVRVEIVIGSVETLPLIVWKPSVRLVP